MMRSTEVSGMLSNPGAVYQAKVVARGIRRGGENGKGGECGVEGRGHCTLGPCTYDVCKILGILDTPLPLIHISRNLSVLFIRKIGQFFNPPSPLSADVICTWSLTCKAFQIPKRLLIAVQLP